MLNYKKLKKLLLWECRKSRVGRQLPTATKMADGEEVESVPPVLLPCATCSRTFRPEALAKHTKVCEKTLMKKRKQFDSSKQRLQGTDPAYVPPPPVPSTKKKESVYKTSVNSKWREKHNELLRTLKTKRGSEDVTASKPSDHEQCPHCERNFGPKAFDRHVEWCKEQQQKIKLTAAPVSQAAKERLEARIKYRAPLSNRILTKDKYSVGSSQKESLKSPASSTPQPPRRSVQRTTSISTPSPNAVNAPRLSRSQSVTRGSTNIREPSPKISLRKNSFTNVQHRSTSNNLNNNSSPANITHINNRNLQDDNHTNNNIKEETRRFNEKTDWNSPSASKKHIVSITSKAGGDKRDAENYDPFASAEQQMLELFGLDSSKLKEKSEASTTPSPIQSSPMSAFAKFSPMPFEKSASTENLKSLESPNGNNLSDDSSVSDEKPGSRHGFSLSSLSLCSIISLDSTDCNKNPVVLPTKPQSAPRAKLNRSGSVMDGKSARKKLDLQQMLYGVQGSKDTSDKNSPVSESEMKALETCEAELLVSMLEFEKLINDSPIPTPPVSSPSTRSLSNNSELENPKGFDEADGCQNRKLSHSIDSAYSSLTRKSPDEEGVTVDGVAKFCHECGTKYPIAGAKFCCNCGIRRLAV